MDGICTPATKTCCAAKGIAYDEAGCRAGVESWCKLRLEAFDAKLVTWNGAKLAPCIDAWKHGLTSCDIDRRTWAKSQEACARLFDGVRENGAACTPTGIESVACKIWSVAARCDPATSRCTQVGASGCRFVTDIPFCDVGWTCVTAEIDHCIGGRPPLGGPCTFGYQCGTYRVCKAGLCAEGLLGGDTCTSGDECSSGKCDAGKCTSISADVATPLLCNGKGV